MLFSKLFASLALATYTVASPILDLTTAITVDVDTPTVNPRAAIDRTYESVHLANCGSE